MATILWGVTGPALGHEHLRAGDLEMPGARLNHQLPSRLCSKFGQPCSKSKLR